jgi:hypothetical protein
LAFEMAFYGFPTRMLELALAVSSSLTATQRKLPPVCVVMLESSKRRLPPGSARAGGVASCLAFIRAPSARYSTRAPRRRLLLWRIEPRRIPRSSLLWVAVKLAMGRTSGCRVDVTAIGPMRYHQMEAGVFGVRNGILRFSSPHVTVGRLRLEKRLFSFGS